MFWPPSERVAQEAVALMQDFADGKIPDPRPFSFAQLEGLDMVEAWAPIWGDYLSARCEGRPLGLSGQNPRPHDCW